MTTMAAALAAEPVPLPLGEDPVVGDRPARLGAFGQIGTSGTLEAGGSGEAMLASRVGLGATIGAEGGEALVGLAARVEILSQDHAPVDLGAVLRYRDRGFDPDRSEMELSAEAARAFGSNRVLLGLTAGRELLIPEGDGEVGLTVLHSFGGVSLGLDSRARTALGGAEEELEAELEAEAEGERPAWDAIAGAMVGVGKGRVGGYAFAGVQALGLRDAETAAGGLFSVGVQLTP